MKAAFETIPSNGQSSFIARRFEEESFSAPYHFHPEYELTLILQGSGKRYVGHHISDYCAGDLVLLGSHLPHCWKTAPVATNNKSISVVVQFQPEFLGPAFFAVPDTKPVLELLRQSSRGICFYGDTTAIQQRLQDIIVQADPFKRLLVLLTILHELTLHQSFHILNNSYTSPALSYSERARMHAVMSYIVENFQGKLSLSAAARKANMTPQAFCKYFKKLSRKTFIEVVNDYRVDYASAQLANTDQDIATIAFQSGFNDVSNFHRTFRKRTQLSPLAYRKKFACLIHE